MRLTHQLTLFIVTLFIFVLIGSLYISIKSSREYLSQKLQTQTQDATVALGIKLQPILLSKDKVLLAVMSNAIFEGGYYKNISIIDMNDKVIHQQNLPVIVKGVPSWFVNMMTIHSPIGKTIIQDKWKQLATLRLVAHTGHAYRELWQVATSSLIWLSLLGIIALAFLWGIIQIVMRPLHDVEKQAGEISRQNFSFRPKLPKTPELRKLVLSMNSMAQKLEHFLSEQSQRINRMRKKIYNDKVTGLMNRLGFENRLNDLLQDQSEIAEGDLLLVRVQGLEQVNQQSGYQQGDKLLQQFVSQLQGLSDESWECARISGTDFVVLVSGYDLEGLNALCERVQQTLISINDLQFYVAGINYRSGQKWSELLSTADIALSLALKSSSRCHALSASHKQILPQLTATEWREKLSSDISNEVILLRSQSCFTSSKQEIHREILLLSQHQGKALPTSVVVSLAHRCGLTEQLDRYVLQKVIELMPQTNHSYAVNITTSSILNSQFLNWLDTSLEAKNIDKQRLILEINEQSLQHQRENMIKALEKIKSLGLCFSFDGVGSGEIMFSELEGLIPRYIKLDGRYSREIVEDSEQQGLVENILLLSHTLSVSVIAQHVESEEIQQLLFSLGVDGVQGYYPAKPVNLSSN